MESSAPIAGTASGVAAAGQRSDDGDGPTLYSRRVGARLRAIRGQKRLSLHDVERHSHQEFKASVLGAYERGERAISVPRLHRLGMLYGVPVEQLLPPGPLNDATVDLRATPAGNGRNGGGGVAIDLVHLDRVPCEQAELLVRYLSMIQVQRQDFNGEVLTIRSDDLGALACLLGCDVHQVEERLDELGVRAHA